MYYCTVSKNNFFLSKRFNCKLKQLFGNELVTMQSIIDKLAGLRVVASCYQHFNKVPQLHAKKLCFFKPPTSRFCITPNKAVLLQSLTKLFNLLFTVKSVVRVMTI